MDTWNRPRTLQLTLSFSLWLSWMLLKDWSVVFIGSGNIVRISKGFSFAGCIFGCLLVLLIARASARPSKLRGGFTIAAAILMMLVGTDSLLLSFGLAIPAPALFTTWFLAGVGESMLVIRIFCSVKQSTHGEEKLIFHLSIFIACLIAMFASSLPQACIAVACIGLALPVLSAVLLAGTLSAKETGTDTNKTPEQRPDRDFRLRCVELFAFSMVFAFGLLDLLRVSGQAAVECAWLGAFLAGLIIMSYSLYLGQKITTDAIKYLLLTLNVITLGIIALNAIVPFAAGSACCTILMLCYLSYFALTMQQLLAFLRDGKTPYVGRVALGWLANALGIMCGWCFAAISVFARDTSNEMLQLAIPVILIVLVIAIIMVCTLVRSNTADSSKKTAKTREESWRRACEALAEEYALSPRETDVFTLLVRGRDSEYICNELFISSHTVRTHVQHIYKKAGVHSQQDLITAVEQCRDELSA